MKKEDWLTTRQFAEAVGRPYDTVIYWLRKGLVPGAQVLRMANVKVYQIPTSIVAQFKKEGPRRGRPPKAKPAAGAQGARKKRGRQRGSGG